MLLTAGRGKLSSWLAALVVVAALILAAQFNGPETRFLAAAMTLVIIWLVSAFLRNYEDGLRIPQEGPALWLTLLWLWIGVSIIWSPVTQVSVYTFWWMGATPLAFCAYTLAPDRAQVWRHAVKLVLILAILLAAIGVGQKVFFGQAAISIFRVTNTHAAVLNMVALVTSGYFLVSLFQRAPKKHTLPLGIALFALFFGVASTGSRGAMISLILGLAVLMAVAALYSRKRDPAMLLAIVLAAFVAADISLQGQITGRIATLAQPASAAFGRLVIWQPAWEIIKESPWFGTGIGTYYLISPPHRLPADASAGYFVHNDYLQLWLEIGAVGLLLLLVLQLSVLWTLCRVLMRNAEVGLKIELAGLVAALLAVSAHSFVDFNFFILVILLLMGLTLARFQELTVPVLGRRDIELHLASVTSKGVHHAVVILLALFPLVYFVTQGLSEYLRNQSWRYSVQGNLPRADLVLQWAQRLTPDNAQVLNTRAELYRHTLTIIKDDPYVAQHQALFDQALEFLDQAQQLNPLNSITQDVKARLYQQNSDLAGNKWRQLATNAFEQALQLDPQLWRTREAYARMLVAAGDDRAALRVVGHGVAHRYWPNEDLLSLLEFALELKRQAGDDQDTETLAEYVRDTRRGLGH